MPLVCKDIPENTGRSINADLMLGQRRRRWANIKSALDERPVFAGMSEALKLMTDI